MIERDAAGRVLCPTCQDPYTDGAHGFVDCIAVLKRRVKKLEEQVQPRAPAPAMCEPHPPGTTSCEWCGLGRPDPDAVLAKLPELPDVRTVAALCQEVKKLRQWRDVADQFVDLAARQVQR